MVRTYLDHNAEILKLSKYGARKTGIVYGANLNFYIIKKRLKELIEFGLLIETYHKEISGKYYHTTPKGEEFLFHFQEIRSLIPVG